MLFNILVSIALWIVGAVVTAMDSGRSNFGVGPFELYSLAAFLPALGVGVRRFHDVGKSGWWTLLGLSRSRTRISSHYCVKMVNLAKMSSARARKQRPLWHKKLSEV